MYQQDLIPRPIAPTIGSYDFRSLQEKWRSYWEQSGLYTAAEDPGKPKNYILDFFPYPSGDGLSVGHCRNYVPTCVATRFRRMNGYDVLHPMGWDAFGLPAENYAIRHNVHPRITTEKQAANYKRQMQLVECAYDWSREINSSDPGFYRWTQWFFLLLFRRGLAYQAVGSQWWCPECQTILANEQVENGRCWRCEQLVTRKDLKQWYFKITAYADRLLADLNGLDWPDSIKQMQRNWIGRSEGAEIIFSVPAAHGQEVLSIPVFTTRPDTLFGATFLALAPEHPLARSVTTAEQRPAVDSYIDRAIRNTEIDRMAADRDKTGVFTGGYARHPLTNEKVPVWIADYVLMGYGTGAIMGVPGHDERDLAFARRMGLPVVEVIAPGEATTAGQLYTGSGQLINSGPFSGMASDVGADRICEALSARGLGRRKVTYKLHDWLISRQRYWGAPIPIIHCPTCGTVPVPDEDLPVRLPEIDDFKPAGDGRSPLARVTEWVNTPCPQCDGPGQRETDTMDGFACSSWYFLRFASPDEMDRPFDPAAVARWLPVDTYVGGAEHAVLHLLYARFWTKVMADAGLIDFTEPFSRLRNQGVLHAPDGRRMSKSRGNVITPDEVIAAHGTDALRAYILFIGPFDADVLWDDGGIKGIDRFLDRYWRLAHQQTIHLSNQQTNKPSNQQTNHYPLPTTHYPLSTTHSPLPTPFTRRLHRTIKRVTEDFEQYKFNTAMAALMEHLNYLHSAPEASPDEWRQALEVFTVLLAPIAPFITEEIWQEVLGHRGDSVHRQPWPTWNEAALVEPERTIVVQVNGRVRDQVTVPADADDETVKLAALSRPNVQRHVGDKRVERVIIVPGRLVNVVVGSG